MLKDEKSITSYYVAQIIVILVFLAILSFAFTTLGHKTLESRDARQELITNLENASSASDRAVALLENHLIELRYTDLENKHNICGYTN